MKMSEKRQVRQIRELWFVGGNQLIYVLNADMKGGPKSSMKEKEALTTLKCQTQIAVCISEQWQQK